MAKTTTRFRQPTDDEMVLLGCAANSPTRGVKTYRKQLEEVMVRYSCDCGCPTFELRVQEGVPRTATKYDVFDVGVAEYDDGTYPLWVILFIRDGRMSELELAPFADSPPSRTARLKQLKNPAGDVLYSQSGAGGS